MEALVRVLRVDSPKKAFRFLSALAVLLSLARATVLFAEAYSSVRSERGSDADLIRLCESGEAPRSLRFRETCMAARADMAAPLLLKALLRAVKNAYVDFAEVVSSPSKMGFVSFFAFTCFAPSIAKAVLGALLVSFHSSASARRRRREEEEEDEELEGSSGVVVLRGPRRQTAWSKARSRLRLTRGTALVTGDYCSDSRPPSDDEGIHGFSSVRVA